MPDRAAEGGRGGGLLGGLMNAFKAASRAFSFCTVYTWRREATAPAEWPSNSRVISPLAVKFEGLLDDIFGFFRPALFKK